MQSFVELWVYLSATPLFGLTATLVTYVLAQALYQRAGHAPWANPVLWTVLTLAVLLTLSGTAYPTYFAGAQFIHFLLGPAVVALAWPLWQRRAEVQRRAGPINLLTHCNAGALATGGIGTALAPIYHAARAGRRVAVLVADLGAQRAERAAQQALEEPGGGGNGPGAPARRTCRIVLGPRIHALYPARGSAARTRNGMRPTSAQRSSQDAECTRCRLDRLWHGRA